ncbi:MAG: Na+/H+ antiporter [Mycobacteriales bacterium]
MHALLVIVLLGVGVVAIGLPARVLPIPSPSLLVIGGVLVALIPGVPELQVAPRLVLYVLLPPLLFAAALDSSLIAIRGNRRSIGLLAVGLVVVTAAAVGAAAAPFLPGAGFAAALALGAVVGPPDAVAATAIARRSGIPRQLVAIRGGGSLFNEATALVLLRVAVTAATAGAVSPLHAVGDFALASVGGTGIGVVIGLGLGWLRRHHVPAIAGTALSLITPFGVYLVGEQARTSGVICVVVVGLMLAHRAPSDLDPATRITESALWSTVQFLLEGAVFALIGLQLPNIVTGIGASIATLIALCAVVLGIVLVIRPLWIFGSSYGAGVVPWSDRDKPSAPPLAVISWAGMRGVVSLAAAQSLPLDFPSRDLMLLVTVVVIVGTLGLQGLSLPWLIRRVGVSPPDPRQDALQIAHAQEQASRAAAERLDELLADDASLPDAVVARLRQQIEFRSYTAWERLGDDSAGEAPTQVFARLRRELVAAERSVFVRLRDSGELDDVVLRKIQRRLDLEESLLSGVADEATTDAGHQEVLPPESAPRCADLTAAALQVPTADPHECPGCVEAGRTDWVHLRVCLTCGQVGCCDSSALRHADRHFRDTGHRVMGSAEPGESWRWCYQHQRVG